MPIKAYYLNTEGEFQIGLNENEIRQAFKTQQGLLWVDISETTEKDEDFLIHTLKFHPLAVEDCVSSTIHAPKIDDFGEYIFIVLHGINYEVESEIVETTELAIFLSPHFVVSNHNLPLYSIEAVKEQVEKDGLPMKRGADFLTHTLADTLIDNILPTIDRMSDVAADIEEETIRNPKQTTMEAILKLKRSSLRVHRAMAPQREILNRLSRGDFKVIGDESKIYYRDVYDHLVRIEDLNQTIQDRVDNTLAIYLSSIANRQNDVMKTLAMVATIFMPLTLLAGIYGMNFENMPELKWEWGYFAVLGVIFTTITVVLWRFWVSGWIAWGRQHMTRVISLVADRRKLIGYTDRNTKRKN
ncbi:magnesium/cobalt transporter CorA [Chloroflexota bacterium]